MDLSGNPELQQIFRDEVEERAANLVEGARHMEERVLSPAEVVDRRRDAHTIKGNALVMGYPHMAEAAKLLEFLLRDIEGGSVEQSTELGSLLGRVASQLSPAVDAELEGPPELLNKAAERLRLHIGLAPIGPDSPGGASPDSSPASAAGEPVAEASDHPGVADNVVAFQGDASDEPLEEPANLGGLVEALEGQLVSETTRVESAKLYRLINRIVELRLDIEAVLADLQTGSDPASPAAAEEAVSRLDLTAQALETDVLDLSSAELVEVTQSFSQLVSFLGRRTGKEVRFEVLGEDTAVDRQIIDALREPLRHLVVNAIDHGIEPPAERVAAGKSSTATLLLQAEVDENLLTITVSDDGRGIDWAKVKEAARRHGSDVDADETTDAHLSRLLFSKSFSTLAEPGDISGDGTGLASVAELVQALNGSISLQTSPEGTSISMTLPSSLALQHVLLVDVGDKCWGIPVTSVLGSVAVSGPVSSVQFQSASVPVWSFAEAVGVPQRSEPGGVVVLTTRSGAEGFAVNRIVGTRRVAVKALGPLLTGAPHLSGAAFLGGGEVVVVVAPEELTVRAHSHPGLPTERPHVLVVDDSRGVRQLVEATLSSEGFDVSAVEDAGAALAALATGRFDALIVDYRLPGSDGVEIVAAVRRTYPAMPVVMVSAVADADDQSRAFAAGVDAYLDKSGFRQGALVSTLRSLLSSGGRRSEVAT